MRAAVLVPVLARPQRALPLAESLFSSTQDARLVFLCSPHDRDEVHACNDVANRYPFAHVLITPFPREPGDYARKINYGVTETKEEWLFQAADDLRFYPGWLEAAATMGERLRKRVVGTQDLGNLFVRRGRHSTHSLIARSYIEEVGTIDEPGKMLHEGYRHNFCDTELVQAAMMRGEWVFAKEAVVEHLHPHWRDEDGTPKGEMDATYELGLSDFHEDQALFMQRRKVWRSRARRRR